MARDPRNPRFTVYPVYRLVTRLRGRASKTNEPPVLLAITPK